MKYQTLFVTLLLSCVICVNAEAPTCSGQPPPYCPDNYCVNGICQLENNKATCHCSMNWKGRCCDKDSRKDKPIKKPPPNYQAVQPEARDLIHNMKCTALASTKNPPGCGFGTAIQLFKVTGDFYVVYFYVRVMCCCRPCINTWGPNPVPPESYNCKDAFPSLGDRRYWTSDSWMCESEP